MNFEKLSKYIFFIFLFLLPFQTVLLLREPMIGGEKWQYGAIGVYATDILFIFSIIFAVIASMAKQSRGKSVEWKMQNGERRNQIQVFPGLPRSLCSLAMTDWILLTSLLWSGLSILWAPDPMLAAYTTVKLALAVGVFFSARSLNEKDATMAIKILFVAAAIQAVIGVCQFLVQGTFVSSILGMSAHDAWTAGSSVLKLESGRWLRAYGSLPHPNMLGGFLAAVFAVCIAYFVSGIKTASVIASVAKQSRKKNFSQMFSGLPRARRLTLAMTVRWAGALIILLALILTFSRAAWIGAALGIGMIVFFQKSQILNHKSKIIFGVFGIAAAVFVFVLRDQVFPRFDVAAIEWEGSVSERVQSLTDAKELITAHPLLGAGAGNFTDAVMALHPDRPVWSVQPAHNVFVLVWGELGIVGLMLFLLFLFSVIASVAKQSRNQKKNLDCHGGETPPRNDREGDLILKNQTVIFAIAFLTILPSLLLDHFLWSSHFGLVFFFLLAGLVSRKD